MKFVDGRFTEEQLAQVAKILIGKKHSQFNFATPKKSKISARFSRSRRSRSTLKPYKPTGFSPSKLEVDLEELERMKKMPITHLKKLEYNKNFPHFAKHDLNV